MRVGLSYQRPGNNCNLAGETEREGDPQSEGENYLQGPDGKGNQFLRCVMLEIRKTGIALDEKELLELERIVIDRDEKEALIFLKKSVYDKVARSQQGKLKSHLDTGGDPVERFRNRQ